MDTTDPLIRFLAAQAEADGNEPLSEAKVRSLSVEDRVVTISDEGVLVALGVAATHPQPDGGVHWSLETVVDRSVRFPAFEDAMLSRAIDMVPHEAPLSVWSRRKSLDDALERAGLTCQRSLGFMTVSLPLNEKTNRAVSHFSSGDEARLLAINRATFGEHREAGGLDESELAGLMTESWFDPSGIVFHEIDGLDAAFCWTKLHESGDGEIYRIGVDPRFQGRGLGRDMVVAGYDHLVRTYEVGRGVLWVDESNRAAVKLYEKLGLRIESRNREFSRSST